MDDSLKTNLALAQEHFARDDWAAAEPHLRAALALSNDLPDAHTMLGVALHARGEFTSAREHFEAALALNPEYTEAALNLAITCNELGHYSEARKVMHGIAAHSRAGGRIDPYACGKLANLHADVARAYEALSLWPEAADEYHKALSLCPEFSDLRTRLALTLRADGDALGAVQQLELAVKLSPAFLPARIALGLSYYSLERVAEAEAAWRAALALDPASRAATVYLRMLEAGTFTPSLFPHPDTVNEEANEAMPEGDASSPPLQFTLLDDSPEKSPGEDPSGSAP